MHILYYITAHGYGHGVRASTICNAFSSNVALTIRTMLPKSFFDEELRRPFNYYPGRFDCGCFQRDFVTIDMKKTIDTYKEIARANEKALEYEIAWCKEHTVDGIVGDIPPFAFEVASGAGIPSVAATNFTWYNIYAPFAGPFPDFAPWIEKIRYQYSLADLLLEIAAANPMEFFPVRTPMPIVGRKGTNRKAGLAARFGVSPDKKLGLIYIGEYGMDSRDWKKLERFENWEFFGLYPLPEKVSNYHRIDKRLIPYQDFPASADLVISKIGYSTVAECMLNGVPLLYLPRDDFAEHPVLERAVKKWGHGYHLSPGRYRALDWDDVLARVTQRKRPVPVDDSGARKCAGEIEKLIGSH
ncbi:MAG: hypothetical protein GF401_03020 [Chitinivibrionales bacterium]|nr:hypothetical protein [Chitinivibrionales bacterium]